MYKITLNNNNTPITKSAKELMVSEIGEMIYINEKHIVLRAYDNIISLTNPQKTWRVDASLLVTLLKPGSSLTISNINSGLFSD